MADALTKHVDGKSLCVHIEGTNLIFKSGRHNEAPIAADDVIERVQWDRPDQEECGIETECENEGNLDNVGDRGRFGSDVAKGNLKNEGIEGRDRNYDGGILEQHNREAGKQRSEGFKQGKATKEVGIFANAFAVKQ